MLEKFLDNYIDNLYNKSNINMELEQRDLYTKEDYYNLLKEVVVLIKENKDLTLEELRKKLYENSKIEENLKEVVFKKEMVPGLVLTFATKHYKETIVIGNRQEVTLDDKFNLVPSVKNMTYDTIFDLASITKIYTSLSIFKLVELGLITLSTEVTKIDSRFKNLSGVTVFDLLTFRVPLITNVRIDELKDPIKAKELLFDIKINENFNKNLNPYSDMQAMVLKYIIEKISGKTYYQFLDETILKPLGLVDTSNIVPSYKLDRTASTLGSVKYYKDGSFTVEKETTLGIIHDKKARIMQQDEDLAGHAGLFSTANDMSKLARSIINKEVITEANLIEMVKNRTGRSYLDEGKVKYVQYLGSLCYSKHPHLDNSELFHAMSGLSFASAGFTGGQFTVDPLNEIYFFLGTNRVHNRLTYLDKEKQEEINGCLNGRKFINIGGQEIIDSRNFAYMRDPYIVRIVLSLALKYKMLEDFYKLTNEKIIYEESIKTI